MGEVEEALEKYQGLVPLVYDIETMALEEARPQDMPYAVYLKREADKVIAHHKYKRCLNNAWWCRTSSNAYAWNASNHRWWKIAEYYDKKAELYRKWCKRWLELAEKFKEIPCVH